MYWYNKINGGLRLIALIGILLIFFSLGSCCEIPLNLTDIFVLCKRGKCDRRSQYCDEAVGECRKCSNICYLGMSKGQKDYCTKLCRYYLHILSETTSLPFVPTTNQPSSPFPTTTTNVNTIDETSSVITIFATVLLCVAVFGLIAWCFYHRREISGRISTWRTGRKTERNNNRQGDNQNMIDGDPEAVSVANAGNDREDAANEEMPELEPLAGVHG